MRINVAVPLHHVRKSRVEAGTRNLLSFTFKKFENSIMNSVNILYVVVRATILPIDISVLQTQSKVSLSANTWVSGKWRGNYKFSSPNL